MRKFRSGNAAGDRVKARMAVAGVSAKTGGMIQGGDTVEECQGRAYGACRRKDWI